MTLAIVQTTNAATAHTQPVKILLTDRSGAHVDMKVFVGNLPPTEYHFIHQTHGLPTSVSLPFSLPPGKYKCTVLIQAFSYGLLNRHYDCDVMLDTTPIATANGNLAATPDHDLGTVDFTITV